MVNRFNRGIGLLIFLILLCGIAMGALGEPIGQHFKSLAFLKNYMTVGMTKPVTLDLKIISITFGISFRANLLSLIGMFMGYLIYRKCR